MNQLPSLQLMLIYLLKEGSIQNNLPPPQGPESLCPPSLGGLHLGGFKSILSILSVVYYSRMIGLDGGTLHGDRKDEARERGNPSCVGCSFQGRWRKFLRNSLRRERLRDMKVEGEC